MTNRPTPSIWVTIESKMNFPSFSVTSGAASGNSSQRRFLALRVISSLTWIWSLPCIRKASRNPLSCSSSCCQSTGSMSTQLILAILKSRTDYFSQSYAQMSIWLFVNSNGSTTRSRTVPEEDEE